MTTIKVGDGSEKFESYQRALEQWACAYFQEVLQKKGFLFISYDPKNRKGAHLHYDDCCAVFQKTDADGAVADLALAPVQERGKRTEDGTTHMAVFLVKNSHLKTGWSQTRETAKSLEQLQEMIEQV